MTKFSFTLLLHVFIVLALVASSNANSFHLHGRDHGRLLRKRAPVDVLGNQSGQGEAQQAPVTSQPVQSSEIAPVGGQTTPANPVSAQTTSGVASTAVASPSTTGGLLESVIGGLLPTESSSASSAASTPSTSSHSSDTPQTSAQASQTPTATPTQSTLYLTTSADSAPSPTQTSSNPSSSGISHTAITVLIVIAACVGASVIAWTIIRKWKFRPSSDFEGRMQPINWQPGAGSEDTGLPGEHHRRLSRSSSFHSGSGHAPTDDQMRGVGGYGATTITPIPDHDFTAGPAHLAPVGGYADLARGPSPLPMMQESFGRAPSLNTPTQYDQYGVPLHHGYSGY